MEHGKKRVEDEWWWWGGACSGEIQYYKGGGSHTLGDLIDNYIILLVALVLWKRIRRQHLGHLISQCPSLRSCPYLQVALDNPTIYDSPICLREIAYWIYDSLFGGITPTAQGCAGRLGCTGIILKIVGTGEVKFLDAVTELHALLGSSRACESGQQA